MISPRAQLWSALNHLIPLNLAGSWDNVGVLIDPPHQPIEKERLFLTIDLTENVLDEAFHWGATVIIAYHPVIFKGIRRFDPTTHLGRVILRCVQAGVAVYSPHSALDAINGGICDWLCAPFSAASLGVSVSELGSSWKSGLSECRPIEADAVRTEEGAGRLITLSTPRSLDQILDVLNDHLGLDYFRVAANTSIRQGQTLIEQIALCPGAGGGLFEKLSGPQLYFTGEMRHHDVLKRLNEDASVILTEHTRCERGYLPLLADRLQDQLGIESTCSQVDEDPLTLWPPRLYTKE